MNKKWLGLIAVIIFIMGGLYFNRDKEVFKIKEDKIGSIIYVYELEDKKMGKFDISNSINKEDISSVVSSLNNGVLIPDKEEVGQYTKEYIEILVLGDRSFTVYKQGDGVFTATYSIYPGSNSEKYEKQTTINSEVLESYFTKFKEISKSLTPN